MDLFLGLRKQVAGSFHWPYRGFSFARVCLLRCMGAKEDVFREAGFDFSPPGRSLGAGAVTTSPVNLLFFAGNGNGRGEISFKDVAEDF